METNESPRDNIVKEVQNESHHVDLKRYIGTIVSEEEITSPSKKAKIDEDTSNLLECILAQRSREKRNKKKKTTIDNVDNEMDGKKDDGAHRPKRISDINPHGKYVFEYYSWWKTREEFMNTKGDNLMMHKDHIHAFTDGSYRNDTDSYGIGIYFLNNRLRPHSESFRGTGGNSNEAEMYAIMRCLEMIPKDKKCLIYTDSSYAYALITSLTKKKPKNHHIRSMHKKIMDIIIKRPKGYTLFKNVKGHHKSKDGNYHADILAGIASANPTIDIQKLCENEYKQKKQ